MMPAFVLVAQVADCEAHDGGLFSQDVNAWSSVAYVAVGLIIVAGTRRRVPRAFAALGLVVVLEGIGSMLFHGGDTGLARFLHDVPLIGLLGAIAGWHVARVADDTAAVTSERVAGDAGAVAITGEATATTVGAPHRGLLVGLACGLLAGAIASAMPSAAINVAAGAAVIVALLGESVARQRGLAAMWNAPLIALLVVAATTWLLGTPGSPVCDEQSLLQPHAAWHVLSALVVLAWTIRADTLPSHGRPL